MVQVGSSVPEVLAAFVASLANMWPDHDDRALQLNHHRRVRLGTTETMLKCSFEVRTRREVL
jgi:hypothetical protein